MIRIEHTHIDGTLVYGTIRGDGAGAILRKVHGHFRWSRTMEAWRLLHSRDRPAKTMVIEHARRALEEAGFTVEVRTDDSARREVADVETERANRAEARAERHDELAARAGERWTARAEADRRVREAIPLGQPLNNAPFIKRLHKSEEIVRRDLEVERHHHESAESARATQRQREDPNVTTRRIERLQAERRSLERNRDQYPPQRYADRHTDLTSQIDHWTNYLADMEARDAWRPWQPEHFRAGDLVACRREWRTVLRVNPKSLTVDVWFGGEKMSWTDRLPYDKVTGRQRDGQTLTAPPENESHPETKRRTTPNNVANPWTRDRATPPSPDQSSGIEPP